MPGEAPKRRPSDPIRGGGNIATKFTLANSSHKMTMSQKKL